MEALRGMAKAARACGMTGIALAAGLDRLDGRPADYLRRVDEVARIAKEFSLDIVPVVFSAGYGSAVLARNRNLAEGLPVKDAPFVVRGGEARLAPEAKVEFPAVSTTLLDPKTRVTREISITPYRSYRLTLRVKSEDFGPWKAFRVQTLAPDGRELGPSDPRVPPASDWHTVTLGFNSAANRTARIAIGARALKTGRIWVDDLRIEEVGLTNVLRRPGTPVAVRSETDGVVYEEGRDFAPIADPALNFRFDHDAPPIQVLPGSRMREGERLRVSYYHGMAINKGQVTLCMSEPEVYAIWEKNARLIQQHLAPRQWFLDMDEVRAGGTCEACRRRKLSMAQILGGCITRQREIIRAVNPNAVAAVWSDMLDPNHNARGTYYLVDGDYSGSWNYIPKDLQIVCWYYEKRAATLAHFSKLGFRTIAGAYYDANDLENPKGWLKSLDETPGAVGIMYTTWEDKYELLPGFGDLVNRRTN